MKKVFYFLLLLSAIFYSCNYNKKDKAIAKPSSDFKIKIFAEGSGYGYDIFKNAVVYIHQATIPAIQGNKTFNTEAQAQRAAEFVVYKIEHNIIPPSVTQEELDSLGVLNH